VVKRFDFVEHLVNIVSIVNKLLKQGMESSESDDHWLHFKTDEFFTLTYQLFVQKYVGKGISFRLQRDSPTILPLFPSI